MPKESQWPEVVWLGVPNFVQVESSGGTGLTWPSALQGFLALGFSALKMITYPHTVKSSYSPLIPALCPARCLASLLIQ